VDLRGFVDGTSSLLQKLQRPVTKKQKSAGLACAIVATASPKVKAIWMMWGESPKAMMLLQPTKTRKNVPKNSADSMRHMLRLSVMSRSPITAFTPVYQHTHFNWIVQNLCD
jgi:hypothetical protein